MAKLCRPWSLVCTCLALISAGHVYTKESSVAPALRVAELRALIAHHDELYFKKAAPEISDFEYDQLKAELVTLEHANPGLVASSTNAASFDDRSGRFPTARHRVPMLGLDKAFDEAALRAFHARVTRELGREDAAFVVEPKIDGIAIAVTYEHGRLVRAVTRGDGVEGDDITANILTIDTVPRELMCADRRRVPDVLEVRGEVFLTFEAFARINREREAAGEPLFANPRNAAAGTAKLNDPAAVEERGLEVAFYGTGACEPAESNPESHGALLGQLRAWGLPTIEDARIVRGDDELCGAVRELGEARTLRPYPTDGAVVKLDDIVARADLGEGSLGPRWAVAFKFAPMRMSTRVRAITVQIGRTGVLTPVAEFEPVALAGSVVARASLHNREALARLDVRVGDIVFVEKAGEIIPTVVGVDRERRPVESVPFIFPVKCPACATSVEVSGGGVILRCPNRECPAQVRRRLEHFASQAAVNIEGLGPATIDALVTRGWVDDPADLYRLQREQLLGLGGDVATSTDALLAAIERSKSVELWRVIHGLGIPRVGETTARDLAMVYPDLATLGELSAEDFATGGRAPQPGFGRATSEAIVAWFAEARHRDLVCELVAVGVRPRATSTGDAWRELIAGRAFVFTGQLAHLSRDEATSRIRAAGGRVAASVSRSTDFLVAGDDPGAKLARARELNVTVIDEAALLRMLTAP